MNRRLARSVSASIACFLLPRSPSSRPEGNGWGFTGRTGKTRYVQLCRLCPAMAILTSSQLFVRRGNTSGQTNDPWTTFEVDLREPAPIPAAFDFIRFLVSSITFMVHIREVGVYFDDKRLAHLTKDVGIPKRLAIPSGLSPTSALEFMRVEGLKSTRKWFTNV